MNILLFGVNAEKLRPHCERHSTLTLVEESPDAVICYGGDGTLLSAEQKWPGITKVPIRNSRRGVRMLDYPAEDVIDRLAEGKLVTTEFIKLVATVTSNESEVSFQAMNEINIQLGRTTSALRFRAWIDDEPFEKGVEIIGDGFLVSTPFGSTAYYRQITRGIFYSGLGIAFKFTSELINHLVIKEESTFRAEITRGPAVVAHDNAPDTFALESGDQIIVRKHPQKARVLAWEPLRRPSEEL